MKVVLSDSGQFVSVSGNTCPRGAKYAEQECTRPLRIVTAVIPVSGSRTPLSVKTSAPVPKELISDILHELGKVSVSLPVKTGDIILPNVFNTGSDIIATRELYSR